MKKSELLRNVSVNLGIQKSVCELVFDSLIEETILALKRGEKISIKDFMTIEIGQRRERDARNPITGEMQRYPAVKTVKCKMSQAVKDSVNGKGETV